MIEELLAISCAVAGAAVTYRWGFARGASTERHKSAMLRQSLWELAGAINPRYPILPYTDAVINMCGGGMDAEDAETGLPAQMRWLEAALKRERKPRKSKTAGK